MDVVARLNEEKSSFLYSELEKKPEKYLIPVAKPFRSRMNVVFRVVKDGKPNEQLEKEFVEKASKLDMICLAGHRSVGGMRASLYNALKLDSVRVLVNFLHEFDNTL